MILILTTLAGMNDINIKAKESDETNSIEEARQMELIRERWQAT